MENTMDTKEKQNLVFALDIGTRSVVGVVGKMVGDTFEVVDYEQRFHAKRAMRDGQIEDITLVAKVVRDVRETLEKRLDVRFDKVSIAAAGRSLKTVKVEYNQEVDPEDEISEKLMEGAEYAALGKAMDEFSQTDEANKKFHCVGYSVIRSALDDYEMSNLVGHKGSKVTLDLIVAFLPHNVVEGLYATMMINGLEVENLTLEPMAAIHVIVPKDIRLLNIALVDIGAGTSDIAICRNGGISAYDMVTVAGDELTEKLMQTYLVDFDEAEKIKLSLGDSNESVSFKDVLGFETIVSKESLKEVLNPAIAELGSIISQRILAVNTTSPVAVFIVGGASQVTGLCEEISKNLELPQNRVTVGGRRGFKYVKLCSEKLQSPEFVTPVGIGAVLSERAGTDFFAITVNGNKIMLLRQGEIKVMEAILLAGIKPTTLIGVPQKPINYTVNGEKHIFRLEYTSGEIKINGELASIDSVLTRGDALTVVPAIAGKKEFVSLGEIKQAIETARVGIGGEWKMLEVAAQVNGKLENDDYIIANGDEIVTGTKNLLKDFCDFIGLDYEGKLFAIDGVDVNLDYPLQNNDMLEYVVIDGFTHEKVQDDADIESLEASDKIQGDGDGETLNGSSTSQGDGAIDEVNGSHEAQRDTNSVLLQKARLSIKKADFSNGKKKVSVSVRLTPKQHLDIDAVDADKEQNKKILETEPKTPPTETQKVTTNREENANTTEFSRDEAGAEGGKETDTFTVANANINTLSTELANTITDVSTTVEEYVPYEQRNRKGYILVTINGIPTKVKAEESERILFVNMLNYVSIEKEAPGENLVLSINSKPAGYTDEVKENDTVVIRWE